MTGLEFSPCRWSCVCSEHAASLEALAELYWRGAQVQQKVSSDIDSIDTELVRSQLISLIVDIYNRLSMWQTYMQ